MEKARKTTKNAYDQNGNQLKQSVSYILPNNTKLRPLTKGTAYGDNIAGEIDTLIEKTSYIYDGFNRLKKTETVKEGIRTTAEYIYSGDDLRVSKTVKSSDKEYIPEVTNYLYDRQNVILETDANNNTKASYIKGINYIAKTDAANNLSYFLFNGYTYSPPKETVNSIKITFGGNDEWPKMQVQTTNGSAITINSDSIMYVGDATASDVPVEVTKRIASAGVGFIPVVGDIKDVQEVITGSDLITGEKLTWVDRGITFAGVFLPIVNGKAVREGLGLVDDGVDLAKSAFKNSDELAQGAVKTADLAASVKWKGFSKGELAEHFTKHGQEFGEITQNQY